MNSSKNNKFNSSTKDKPNEETNAKLNKIDFRDLCSKLKNKTISNIKSFSRSPIDEIRFFDESDSDE